MGAFKQENGGASESREAGSAGTAAKCRVAKVQKGILGSSWRIAQEQVRLEGKAEKSTVRWCTKVMVGSKPG